MWSELQTQASWITKILDAIQKRQGTLDTCQSQVHGRRILHAKLQNHIENGCLHGIQLNRAWIRR